MTNLGIVNKGIATRVHNEQPFGARDFDYGSSNNDLKSCFKAIELGCSMLWSENFRICLTRPCCLHFHLHVFQLFFIWLGFKVTGIDVSHLLLPALEPLVEDVWSVCATAQKICKVRLIGRFKSLLVMIFRRYVFTHPVVSLKRMDLYSKLWLLTKYNARDIIISPNKEPRNEVLSSTKPGLPVSRVFNGIHVYLSDKYIYIYIIFIRIGGLGEDQKDIFCDQRFVALQWHVFQVFRYIIYLAWSWLPFMKSAS